MSTFNVPQREEVSEKNQAIFDNLEKAVGFVPNLQATYAHSENALENYLNLSNAKTSLTAKQKEVVNLAVSQVNNCTYCLSAHTAIGKMNGFTEAEILELTANPDRAAQGFVVESKMEKAYLAKQAKEKEFKELQDRLELMEKQSFRPGGVVSTDAASEAEIKSFNSFKNLEYTSCAFSASLVLARMFILCAIAQPVVLLPL